MPEAMLTVISFDEEKNLPALVEEYHDHKQRAIDLVLKVRPFA